MRLIFALRRAEHTLVEEYKKRSDISVHRLLALSALDSLGSGASQSDIVGASGIDRSSLSTMLQSMEREGLVVQHRKPGARNVAVRLTAKGKKALHAANTGMTRTEAAMSARFTTLDYEALFRSLNVVANA